MNISERTYQRWTAAGEVALDQRPIIQRPTPKNKISEKERNDIIQIATSAEYADLPPSQIVPKLADKGEYVASESTFYRVLKEERLSTHRTLEPKKQRCNSHQLISLQPQIKYGPGISHG